MAGESDNFYFWFHAKVSRLPSFALASNYIAVLVTTAVHLYSGCERGEKDHEQPATKFVSLLTFTEREMET